MQSINLNLIPKGIPDVVNVSQYDVGRQFKVVLYDGANKYTIDPTATVQIGGKKGDNHIFIYDQTDGYISFSGSEITITTSQQMTAYAGDVLCQLRIIKNLNTIASLNFKMLVQARPDAEGDISDTDIPGLIALAQEEVLDSEAWAKGTKNGVPVTSSDIQYNDHSKYWAEQARQYAHGVSSFNGRTGDVTPAANDYSAAQISGLGTAAVKNVPASGNASATEVVMGNDTRLTYTKSILATVSASGWSATTDSDGYYTNTVSLSSGLNTSVQPIIGVSGSTVNTVPTAAQKAAFNLCELFSFADGTNITSVTVKAKTKPTETFYVIINGESY